MTLFGTSGVRGVYGDFLSPELAFRLGRAAAGVANKILMGFDQRLTSPLLSKAFTGGANSGGADVTDIGLAPTPTIAYAAGALADVGVSITASHNPPEYNGIKFWNKDGSGFSKKQEQHIESLLDEHGGTRTGRTGFSETSRELHRDAILERVKNTCLKIVVNCNCGSAGVIAPELMQAIGCKIIPIFSKPDGAYVPNTTYSEGRIGDWAKIADLAATSKAVVENKADLGVCFDGDADRVFLVDGKGKPVAGDDLMAAIVSRTKGDVVTIVDASMSIDKLASGRVFKVPVGDVNVSVAVKENRAAFGGEAASGAYVWPELHLCPDGIFGACKLIEMAANDDLFESIDKVPKYPLVRARFPCTEKIRTMERVRKLSQALNPENLLDIDGVRAEFGDGWFLIRPSGTENVIRITAEAETEKRVQEILEQAKTVLKDSNK